MTAYCDFPVTANALQEGVGSHREVGRRGHPANIDQTVRIHRHTVAAVGVIGKADRRSRRNPSLYPAAA